MTRRRPDNASLRTLSVEVVQRLAGQVVTVSGWIDARAASGLRDRLQQVVDAGHGDLVLLLADAEIGDVTALGLLVGIHHRARRAGRRLVVSEVSERTGRLLRAAHLDRVLVGVSESTRPEPVRAESVRAESVRAESLCAESVGAGQNSGQPTGGAVAPLTAYLRP